MPDLHDTHFFLFSNMTVDNLTEVAVAAASPVYEDSGVEGRLTVNTEEIAVDRGVFICRTGGAAQVRVAVVQDTVGIAISSDVAAAEGVLTPAESAVLVAILRRDELGVFFRRSLRLQWLRQAAVAYGLEHEPDPEQYLVPALIEGQLIVQPRIPGLLPLDSAKLEALVRADVHGTGPQQSETGSSEERIIVVGRHKYYRHIRVDVIHAGRTAAGKLKPPFVRLQPLGLVASASGVEEAKFYAAIAAIQQATGDDDRTLSVFEALQTVVKYGDGYRFYIHDDSAGRTVNSKTLTPIDVRSVSRSAGLSIRASGVFYVITGVFQVGDREFPLHVLPCVFGYFLRIKDTLYLPDSSALLDIAALLREQEGRLLIHSSKYRLFKREVIDKLPAAVRVEYPDIATGTENQLQEGGFADRPERLLYLSEFGEHVMVIPVVRYGEAEVAVRTEQQLTAVDGRGNDFKIPRDTDFEEQFLQLLVKQHPYFIEQLDNPLYYFYLHKKYFLDESWFLPAFEAWQEAGIAVFGFNELTGNELNANKVSVTIKVISGINWFNAVYDIRFGKEKAALKKVQAALRNKRNYVVLDDGTKGVLPEEWIERFSGYFRAGEMAEGETIRFAKANFETVAELFDKAMLDAGTEAEIVELRKRVADFDRLPVVPVPRGISVELRPYQRRGLNWLHFLDTFRFGGVLADEMGLGKTVQIIAFMQSLREQGRSGTDLVVVPATLIFNWERELATVAPSLRVLTLYGPDREKTTVSFDRYDVVLTSYATLLSDIRFLKTFGFGYVFLDESQNIKNADSQRYKAARLLQAYNRIAISGTPFENSSFDLYGQLSFACPGLLGDKRYFRDVYGKPIDQFKNKKRRLELRRKIQPFILRRTKAEVASELPDKVSHILYSEMGASQRKIYEAYEKEFRDFVCALSGEKLDKSPMHVLRGLTRLRQICNSPALLPDGMLNTAVSAKVELLRTQVADKAPHHKIVIFSQFVSMLRLVGNMLEGIDVPYVSLTGGTRRRSEVVAKFHSDPDVRVFLVSLKAGGTGLNLTAADVVYLVDPWWNPAVENQAIDRVHRIGQQKDVVAYRLVTPDTVEEKVLALQAAKSTLAGGLLETSGSFFRTLDKDQLLGLL